MEWLIPDKLATFDEKVRIELSPQIIELECNDENLSDEVTHPTYKVGNRDSYGRIIGFSTLPEAVQKVADMRLGKVEKGEMMAVVDWRSKHVPHLWKIYQWQETEELDKDKIPLWKFIKVAEREDRDEALTLAQSLFEEMQ